MRLRLAPSERRTAISRCRATARASITFDTLKHAVSRTSAKAAKTGDRIASSSSDSGFAVALGKSAARTEAGGTFGGEDPEEGIMRVTVNGDWTNAGDIGATVNVYSVTDPVPQLTHQGTIANGETVSIPLVIPAGTTMADFRLGWRESWAQYPTSDLDLILIRPNGTVVFTGATLSSPEQFSLANPAAGNWLMIVAGFDIAARADKYELRVALNGQVVK